MTIDEAIENLKYDIEIDMYIHEQHRATAVTVAESEVGMTESEAIKELHTIRPRGSIIPQKRAEAIDMAIKALEKQEKIKDLLDSCTAYPDDMCDCLVEIEKILRSDEE